MKKDPEVFSESYDSTTERYYEGPFKRPDLDGRSAVERERLALQYCEKMPGAVRLCLDPGDFALYRNTMWHLGNYLPYCKRATLHTTVFTSEFEAWYTKMGLLS